MEVKKIRSPSYPSLDLEGAIDRVRKIQAAYSTSSVDREALAKIMDYSGLSGAALQALASIASYGLLERRGKGEAGVTDLAMQILFAESPGELAQATREAALSPAVFSQLEERFAGHVPHRDGVIAFLCRNGFTTKAAGIAAKSYVTSMQYIASLGDTDRSEPEPEGDQNTLPPMAEEGNVMLNQPANAGGGFHDLVRGNTSDGTAFRLLVNSDFGAEQWEDAMELLAVQLKIAKRKAKRDAVPAETDEAL